MSKFGFAILLFVTSFALLIGRLVALQQPRFRHSSLLSTARSDSTGVTAVILVDHGSKRSEANQHLENIAEKFRRKTCYNIVEAAHMEIAEPSISTAFRKCVEQGANNILCLPFFLARGKHIQEDIPHLMSEAAKEFPGVSFKIAEPLGLHEGIVDLLIAAVEPNI